MKRFLLIIILLMSIILFCDTGNAEEADTGSFSSTLQALCTDQGWSVVSESVCGSSGAAILSNADKYSLAVFSCRKGQWCIAFQNDYAFGEGSSVVLDTEDILILNIPETGNAQIMNQYYFKRETGYMLSYVIRYEGYADEWKLSEEHHAWLSDGWLHTKIVYTDENGNVEASRNGMPLPNVLTEEEQKLESFHYRNAVITANGYAMDESMCISDDVLGRLFAKTVPEGYTYVDGCLTGDGLQIIADQPNGERVLLCCEYLQDHALRITKSTLLPAGTLMGIENFRNTLNLGQQGYGVTVGRYSNGTWGVKEVLADELFSVGACGISQGGLWQNASSMIGTHPWNDITRIDWTTIPHNLNEATGYLDTSSWATPKNPDPQDRLHLRAQANSASRSLGKYYNGTPVRVLEKGGEWTKVMIGNTIGYMMTKYLLFGKEINTQASALGHKQQLHRMTEIRWEGENTPEMIPGNEVAQLLVIGVVGDQDYLVWEPFTDHYGSIRQSELWDGNG